MEINWISSKVCIARVFDTYNIDYSGFVGRVPNWIYNALGELGSYFTYIHKESPVSVVDYRCEIPIDAVTLLAISYEGLRLKRLDVVNYTMDTDMTTLYHPTEGYEVVDGNHIITTFETGDIIFYYKAMPVVLDPDLNLYFPTIPNNEKLLLGLDAYILTKLLQRGHKVREYTLTANNEFINPALYWKNNKQSIRNSLTVIDLEERELISGMIRTFLVDFNTYDTIKFNPYSK